MRSAGFFKKDPVWQVLRAQSHQQNKGREGFEDLVALFIHEDE
jgi:hypothetical protein